ncbi:MAG: diaminopimelate dehydrogenase [Oscillospiraceae bacterium]|nr:diaminopimelate dehydrogenase [Oscillospiraceae bacterium]MCL2249603.1 diaminopimelate dehydrogenase [Oscillospiraceae bacterium]
MIRVGIVGYGNVGKGAALAVTYAPDMELSAIFTRRDPASIVAPGGVPVFSFDDALSKTSDIDVMILCGGSATDLPEQGPYFAKHFNIVDSFDTHAKIPEYLASIDAVAKNKTAVIASGWDPGLFSLMRVFSEAVLPNGATYTFWGKGVSQGHSDAIRRIEGVKNAVQYTIPVDAAIEAVRSGQSPAFETREKHIRECFVVAEGTADRDFIEKTIKEMPNYFSDYDTTVHFIDESELLKSHSKMPHGGLVMRSGSTDSINSHVIEFSLTLESNPEFTASIIAAYARAAYRLAEEGKFGAKTVFDIPPAYLAEKSREEVIRDLL